MKQLDIIQIQKIIPHRYPFLFIDRAELLDDESAVYGYKAVTMNEWFFQGHYPKYPVMPGVIILEALAQTFCVMLLSRPGYENKIPMLIGIEDAKFRNQVKPGDTIRFYVEFIHEGTRAGKVRGGVSMNGKLVMEGTFKYVVVDHNVD